MTIAEADLVAQVRDVLARQMVQRVAAEHLPPAHRAPVGGRIAAEVAEVETAGEVDRSVHRTVLHRGGAETREVSRIGSVLLRRRHAVKILLRVGPVEVRDDVRRLEHLRARCSGRRDTAPSSSPSASTNAARLRAALGDVVQHVGNLERAQALAHDAAEGRRFEALELERLLRLPRPRRSGRRSPAARRWRQRGDVGQRAEARAAAARCPSPYSANR